VCALATQREGKIERGSTVLVQLDPFFIAKVKFEQSVMSESSLASLRAL
jgi:hypothetical protein